MSSSGAQAVIAVEPTASLGDPLDDCPAGVVSVGADGIVRRWNAACVALLGTEVSTALGNGSTPSSASSRATPRAASPSGSGQ